MIPNNKNINELENELKDKLSSYKELRNSDNSFYFNSLYFRASDKLLQKTKQNFYEHKLINVFLFLIVFIISYNVFNFNDTNNNFSVSNNYFLEASLPWLDEEYFDEIVIDEEVLVDYNTLLEEDPNLFGYLETLELLNNLPTDKLNEIYNNIKYKKM